MDKRVWPSGISADGAGLRLRIFDKRRTIYSETIKGDAHSPSFIASAEQRLKWLKARHLLGLPLTEGEKDSDVFEDVAQGYMNTLDAKHSTHMSYENILNHYWLPHFTSWPIEDITTRKIKEILALFDVATKTKRNILIPLRGLLDHGEVNPNPCNIKLKRRKGRGGSPVSYTPAEREALMDKLENLVVPSWLEGQPAAYFALLFGCGLRPCGEVLALQWPDYDGMLISVNKQITKRRLQRYTKTDLPRKVYVPAWVKPYLNKLPSRFDGRYIFTNSLGGPFLDSDHMNDAWREAHKKARISYQEPYACRHTRASELLSTGIQAPDAAKQLGHSVEMFHQIYAEWVEEFSGNSDLTRFEGMALSAIKN